MQTKACSIFLLRKIDMFFVSLKTRYDINLVAVRQHIECEAHIESFMTYREFDRIHIDALLCNAIAIHKI